MFRSFFLFALNTEYCQNWASQNLMGRHIPSSRLQIVELINSFPLYLAVWLQRRAKMRIEFKSWIHLHSSIFFSHAKYIKFTSLYHRVRRDKIRNQIGLIEHGVGVYIYRGEMKRSETIVYACKMYFCAVYAVKYQSWICEHWAVSTTKTLRDLFYESIWFRLVFTSRCCFRAETLFSQLTLTHHSFAHFYIYNLMNCDEKQILRRFCHAVLWSFFTKLYRSLVDAVGNWIKFAPLADLRQTEKEFSVTQIRRSDGEYCRSSTECRHFASNFMEPSSSEATDWARKTLCANICTSRPIYLRCVSFRRCEEFRLHK